VVDSNCDPRRIRYPFPGNDDASRAINLYCDVAVAAVLDGIQAEMTASGADLGALEELPVPLSDGAEEPPAYNGDGEEIPELPAAPAPSEAAGETTSEH
jgi:small subunit ribosomal protein S2